MKPRLYLFIGMLFISASCTQKMVPAWFHAQSQEPPAGFIETGEIEVYFENLEVKQSMLIFNVKITNRGNSEVYFNPENMYYYTSATPFQPISSNNADWELDHAEDIRYPARNSDEAAEYYMKKADARSGWQILIGVIGTGLAIYDAVKDGQDAIAYNAGEWSSKKEKKSILRDVAVGSSMMALHATGNVMERSKQKDLEDLHYLKDEILRSQKIRPGGSVSGRVFFPRPKPYDNFRFVIPFQSEDYSFVFDFKKASPQERMVIRERF